MTQLESRRMQLDESREALKSMQLDKASLTQQNKQMEQRIKDLLEELKLTKLAEGEGGEMLAELNKNLKIARDSALKFENLSDGLQKTLDTRTTNFQKEKADLKERLDQALADLKKGNSSSSDMIAENAGLKDELKTVKKKLNDTEMQLDVITEQIAEKIEKILKAEKDKLFAVKNMEKME